MKEVGVWESFDVESVFRRLCTRTYPETFLYDLRPLHLGRVLSSTGIPILICPTRPRLSLIEKKEETGLSRGRTSRSDPHRRGLQCGQTVRRWVRKDETTPTFSRTRSFTTGRTSTPLVDLKLMKSLYVEE